MNYNINIGLWGKVFAVPLCIADNYIKLASGSAIKVLLYVLANNSKDLAAEEISKAVGITAEQVDEAFCFWEEVQILSKNDIEPQTAEETALEKSQPVQNIQLSFKSTGTLTPKEIAERIESSKEIAFLFSTAESSLQHLLTHTEQRSLIWMHDYLGLPADVILMLIEYCRIIGKTSARYIERVAVSWHEKEILTHDSAEKEIQALKLRKTLCSQIISAFGIGNRTLSSKEESYIADWTVKNYDIELISYAYDKTIDSINKLSFPYINKILNDWYTKGLLTKEQIDKENESFPKAAPKAKEHSYDLDKFDTLAINYAPKAKNERTE